MANIKVSELRPAGSEFFQDSESFLNDLNDMDTTSVHGGEGTNLVPYLQFGAKLLEYSVVGLGITTITSLVGTFSSTGTGIGSGSGSGGSTGV
ncbi:hypothetical protein [Calothrix sp. NIES-2098]|uniref:hypothetical protein n=1 Tax=Calothrix sp. NIES-2098 TaxID=1954171 RepID=UPI000B61FCEB|nr:hypothetical protein NIES2098_12530 [Calothrix sp. NIES-2098]